MEKHEILRPRSLEEFNGEEGLIRRFSENGESVDTIINSRNISLLSVNFVEVEESGFTVQAIFDKFQEVQEFFPEQAPFTAIKTRKKLSAEDIEKGQSNEEWCLVILGRSVIDMHDRDTEAE